MWTRSRSRTGWPNAVGELLLSRSTGPVIGVLALQGDVREHAETLRRCGATPRAVRYPDQLNGLAGLIIPGGESTTIDRLARIFELRDPLVAAIRGGLPTYGSCAGMILLADRVLDGRADQQTFGGLDVTVRRNAFGRQISSFEADVTVAAIEGAPVRAVFIRAPWVEMVGPGVEVLARIDVPGADEPRIVAVRHEGLLATAFHPEITGDRRIHQYFVDRLCS